MPSFSLPPPTQEAELELLPGRAAYWAERKTLLVADVHVGKDATFRAEAIPLPLGSTDSDLQKLTGLIRQTRAERLIVLGDLYHARSGMTEGTLQALRAWRSNQKTLNVVLVRGNHDRHAGASPADLDIDEHEGPLHEGPFCFRHEPSSSDTGYVVCGHLHPGVVLRGRGGQRERLPCFHANESRLILPAFSEFTGLHILHPEPGDDVAVVAGTDVIAVSPEVLRSTHQ
ncbi:DEAD/DEAH box helicase [Longibacter salinarum]|uniref:DEAD/DEAH box helicase n=1 Tax=Longibacter salinarum TaxID=1850348 RepID=A0A2A8CUG4_9BACT|nr:ligase-associated DNA damage response endonuclease PdeM [Longibacter salinarum]PEN11168.1 DEAD/DEAH box helicase [Longibacter salinarum]